MKQAPAGAAIWIDSTKADGKTHDLSTLMPAMKQEGTHPWDGWTRLNGTSLEVNSNNNVLSVLGMKTDFGFSILIVNRSEFKTPFKLTARMVTGTYLVEKLGFGLEDSNRITLPERMESIAIDRIREVVRPQWIEPKSALIIKFVNQSNLCQKDLSGLHQEIKALYSSRQRESRLLSSPLKECIAQVDAICYDATHRTKSRARIQRALLSISQVEALAENFRRQGQISDISAKNIQGALTETLSHLMDLSFVCFNIVPTVVVSKPDIASGETKVQLSLNNLGDQSVVNVKLGIIAPSGVTVSPEEAAVFSGISPGQKASAEFHIKGELTSQMTDIKARFAYFAQRTPVHAEVAIERK